MIVVIQNTEIYETEKTSRLIKICMNLFKTNDGMLILVTNKSPLVQIIVRFYNTGPSDGVSDEIKTSIQEDLKR